MEELAGEGFVLLVGPSPRLGSIAPLLAALSDPLSARAAAPHGRPRSRIRTLDDLGDLAVVSESYGRVLLDADDLPAEDLGIVRRFFETHPGFEVWLAGETHDTPAARRFSTADDVRLVPWPLDVDQLAAFAEPFVFVDEAFEAFYEDDALDEDDLLGADELQGEGRPSDEDDSSGDSSGEGPPEDDPWAEDAGHEDVPRTRVARIRPHDDDPEMAAIAGILSTHGLRGPEADLEPSAPPAPAPRTGPFEPSAPSAGTRYELPPFYREQIADLADIAQRLRLSVGAAADSADSLGGGVPPRLAELEGEVARLQQFTRTLGYLVAPPAPGHQEFDVAVVLEEMLGTLASGPDAPRFLFKGSGPMVVRSDKALLFQAFDALLQVAAGCGRSGEKVRVSVEPNDGADGAESVSVRVSFPAGPLAGLEPNEIVRPYALKRHLPAIGPNALAAAQGIVTGQGGALELVREMEPDAGQDRLAWEALLPRCGTGRGTDSNGREEGRPPTSGPFD